MVEQERSAIFKHDAYGSPPDGTTLSFNFVGLPVLEGEGFGEAEPWDSFDTVLLALMFNFKSLSLSGSAVLIGVGLALAAKHVFEHHIEEINNGAFVTAVSIGKQKLTIWRVREAVLCENSDIAILRLELCSELEDSTVNIARLTARSPKISEKVMILGIRPVEISDVSRPVSISVSIGIGEVTQIYREGRDRILLPHPCIEVACKTLGAMSGGPAFDMDGNLIGILSTSFDLDGGPSYITPWWLASLHEINSAWLPGPFEIPTNILKMAKNKCVVIREGWRIVENTDGSVTFHVWD